MKKSILLLTLSITIFISCSKSDDNNSSTPLSSIVGKWDLKAKMTGTTNVVLYPCEEQYNQYQFFENLTAIEDEGYTNGGTSCTHYTYNETYTIANNKLTIIETSSNGQYVYEYRFNILELTSTKLKLKIYYTNEKHNGTLTFEENIPESQQTTSSYDKV